MAEQTAWPIYTIVTHLRPHLDELAAIWALRIFGEERYPGVENAKIDYFSPDVHLDGRPEEAWLREGYLFLGVRQGKFDDHPHEEYPADCAFTLILKDLGVDRDPALRKLMRDVLSSDRHGSPHPLHLEGLTKVLHRVYGFGDIVDVVTKAIQAYYLSQVSFQEALDIARMSRQIRVTNLATGQELVLAITRGDNEDIARAARSREGLHAALVLHWNSQGHTYISANGDLGIRDVSGLAQTLRLAEQRAYGTPVRVRNEELLRSDGTLPEVPEWHVQLASGQIFNGTPTHPENPRTNLSEDELVEFCTQFLARTRLVP